MILSPTLILPSVHTAPPGVILLTTLSPSILIPRLPFDGLTRLISKVLADSKSVTGSAVVASEPPVGCLASDGICGCFACFAVLESFLWFS